MTMPSGGGLRRGAPGVLLSALGGACAGVSATAGGVAGDCQPTVPRAPGGVGAGNAAKQPMSPLELGSSSCGARQLAPLEARHPVARAGMHPPNTTAPPTTAIGESTKRAQGLRGTVGPGGDTHGDSGHRSIGGGEQPPDRPAADLERGFSGGLPIDPRLTPKRGPGPHVGRAAGGQLSAIISLGPIAGCSVHGRRSSMGVRGGRGTSLSPERAMPGAHGVGVAPPAVRRKGRRSVREGKRIKLSPVPGRIAPGTNPGAAAANQGATAAAGSDATPRPSPGTAVSSSGGHGSTMHHAAPSMRDIGTRSLAEPTRWGADPRPDEGSTGPNTKANGGARALPCCAICRDDGACSCHLGVRGSALWPRTVKPFACASHVFRRLKALWGSL